MATKTKAEREVRALIDTIAQELGVEVAIDIVRAKHIKAYITLNGQTKFVVTSATRSDWRALRNLERDIKRLIEEMKS